MLAVLMYHDVVQGGGKYANDPEILRAHLKYVRKHYPVVFPGDPLPADRLGVCLTFDDAHAGFYFTVYPMLKELGIKAVIGVATGYILEDSDLPPRQRIRTSSQTGRQGQAYRESACFCTWKELREMAVSGLVHVGCHSANHVDLTAPGVDLDREIRDAGQKITKRLGIVPETFIFPHGRVNSIVKRKAKRHYSYLMRIGEALNRGWDNPGGLLYRLQGDGLASERGPLRSLWKPKIRYYWNTLRLR